MEWPFVRTIRIRLGHELLDLTLAYLKGKYSGSEETQEHANSNSLARREISGLNEISRFPLHY